MAKMEIELTEDQLKKVEILKQNDIDVGKAIDMLFEVKEKVLSDIETFDDEKIGLLGKVKENVFDVESKAENLEDNFGEGHLSTEMQVQEFKHKIRWARDFFKF